MKKKIIVSAITLMSMLSLVSFAFAGQRGNMSHHRMGEKRFMKQDRIEELFEWLELTPDQIDKTHELIKTLKKEQIKHHADIKLIGLDLEDEFRKGKIDRGRVEKIIDDILKKRKAMMMTKLDLLIKFKEILTVEQNEKLGRRGPGFFRFGPGLGGGGPVMPSPGP